MGEIRSAGQRSRSRGSCSYWNGLHSLRRSSHLGSRRKILNSANTNTDPDANADTNANADSDTDSDTNAWS